MESGVPRRPCGVRAQFPIPPQPLSHLLTETRFYNSMLSVLNSGLVFDNGLFKSLISQHNLNTKLSRDVCRFQNIVEY